MKKTLGKRRLILAVSLIAFIIACDQFIAKPVAITDLMVIKVNDLADLPPPPPLKQFLASNNDPLLTLIHYDGLTLYFHDGIPGDLTSNKYLTAFKTFATSKQYTLLPGWYLLSMRDGVHTDLGWPVLAFAGSKEQVDKNNVILMPDPEAMNGYAELFAKIEDKLEQYKWEYKVDKVFWRGSITGDGSREKFVNYARTLDFTNVDFKQAFVPPEDSIAFKYLFDIDGNSCSYSRMAWSLYSNSLLMKHQSNNVQWYYAKLQPYVHYVPIAEDFSDLPQQFAWAQAHEQDAQAIALNGRRLAQEVFDQENVLRSLEQALIAYNKVVQSRIN